MQLANAHAHTDYQLSNELIIFPPWETKINPYKSTKNCFCFSFYFGILALVPFTKYANHFTQTQKDGRKKKKCLKIFQLWRDWESETENQWCNIEIYSISNRKKHQFYIDMCVWCVVVHYMLLCRVYFNRGSNQ